MIHFILYRTKYINIFGMFSCIYFIRNQNFLFNNNNKIPPKNIFIINDNSND